MVSLVFVFMTMFAFVPPITRMLENVLPGSGRQHKEKNNGVIT
jgi:hypothetical protein